MMIEVLPEERDLLIALVEHEIAELGSEIHHTDARTYREELKVEKRTLFDLLKRLRETDPISAG